jgi:TPR repeat protein
VGREPDAARARKWYQKAMELGSEVASQQLAKLAQVRQ